MLGASTQDINQCRGTITSTSGAPTPVPGDSATHARSDGRSLLLRERAEHPEKLNQFRRETVVKREDRPSRLELREAEPRDQNGGGVDR